MYVSLFLAQSDTTINRRAQIFICDITLFLLLHGFTSLDLFRPRYDEASMLTFRRSFFPAEKEAFFLIRVTIRQSWYNSFNGTGGIAVSQLLIHLQLFYNYRITTG